ncbi:MAG TPA: ABC transporter permease subunit [Micromonosporaceae bacterium]|nr:ABC transporter permease subunit [Micromonosporaceae bacterium]
MNLVRAELERLLARRFTRVLLVFMFAAFLVTFLTMVSSTHTPTPAELAQAEQALASDRINAEEWYRSCVSLNGGEEARTTSRVIERCGPDTRSASVANYLSQVFVFSTVIRPLVYFLAAFLALFGFLVGASYVGAELTSGGMTNLLLWRPRRDVVLGTKLATLLGTVLAVSVLVTAGYVGAFWGLANSAGMPGTVSRGFWISLGLLCVRAIGLGLLFTALGFGIATLGRHTAAALGVIAGYLVVWEVGARIVLAVTQSPRSELLMLSTYIAAWMNGRVSIYPSQCFDGACGSAYDITFGHAAVAFGLLLAVCVGGAFVNFRRRDLT